MTAAVIGAAGLVALAVAWEIIQARRQRRWREHHEARLMAAAERRAQANARPYTGQVTHLGPHR